MNKKTLLTSSLCLAFLLINMFSAYSQTTYYPSESGSSQDVESSLENATPVKKYHNAYKTTWKKNRFKDTWYITIGGGAQILIAEDDSQGAFADRITAAPTVSIGKYFSPIWGLRVQFTGGSLHGFNDGRDGTYRKWNNGDEHYMGKGYISYDPTILNSDGTISSVTPDGLPNKDPHIGFMTWDPQWSRLGFRMQNEEGTVPKERLIQYDSNNDSYYWTPGLNPSGDKKLYMQHVRYAAANINFMFNFLTLVGDYNPNRFFDITPFAGVTYAHVFPHYGYEAYDTFGANAGLNFKFRLSNKFDFNLEGAMTMYPDEFDGHMGGSNTLDLVGQATAGITYKIGKSTWEVADPMNYEMIQDLNQKINDMKMQLADLNKPCPECPKCPEPVVTTDSKSNEITFLPDPVFFRIDKSVIDQTEWSKIEKAADYLQKNQAASVVVTGYADRQTAYPAYNMRLSERRAKTVSKALIEKYGINPLRVSINWEGDKIQPFEVNEWNRVVIFVIDK